MDLMIVGNKLLLDVVKSSSVWGYCRNLMVNTTQHKDLLLTLLMVILHGWLSEHNDLVIVEYCIVYLMVCYGCYCYIEIVVYQFYNYHQMDKI